jgi:hypothetical protein
MSRRPTDTFTRFTANSPHAAQSPTFDSRSTGQSPSRPTSQPGPEGETPAQKVARLRAAARAQKTAQLSATDRALARGRIWADRAHRFTAVGLIALTGLSAVVGAYGLVSLISHNRRQKRAWVENQMDRLHEAQKAFLRGDANAEQLHLLEQERAGDEMAAKFKAEKEQRKSEGIWSKVKGVVGAGAADGDKGEETEAEKTARQIQRGRKQQTLGEQIEGEIRPSKDETEYVSAVVRPSGIEGVGLDSKGRPVPANKMERVVKKVGEERRKGEEALTTATGQKKGPLDEMADNISAAVTSQESRGWFSWGRSS